MRCLSFCLLLLAGCADPLPGPPKPVPARTAYPALLPLRDVLSRADAPDRIDGPRTRALAERAAALRSRAAALRPTALSPAERRRLGDAARRNAHR